MQEKVFKAGKPFLRWAGGKSWLIKQIYDYLPEAGFNRYVEPFLGGGSIFFHLAPKQAVLSDLNSELVEVYHVLKEDVESIITSLKKFRNTEEYYYKVRSQRPRNEVNRAARFIFLNQTSFNGIFRVNLKGEYNVPYGHRKKNFLQPENLRQASIILQNADLVTRDFASSIIDIGPGDLVFLDPPYTVTHNSNGFIKYNSKLFDLAAQHRLSRFLREIHEAGAYYVLTNAAHQEIENIFTMPDQNRVIETSRASLVGGKKAQRGRYKELIVTNVGVDGRQSKS